MFLNQQEPYHQKQQKKQKTLINGMYNKTETLSQDSKQWGQWLLLKKELDK